jgi:hypothetical protein
MKNNPGTLPVADIVEAMSSPRLYCSAIRLKSGNPRRSPQTAASFKCITYLENSLMCPMDFFSRYCHNGNVSISKLANQNSSSRLVIV